MLLVTHCGNLSTVAEGRRVVADGHYAKKYELVYKKLLCVSSLPSQGWCDLVAGAWSTEKFN